MKGHLLTDKHCRLASIVFAKKSPAGPRSFTDLSFKVFHLRVWDGAHKEIEQHHHKSLKLKLQLVLGPNIATRIPVTNAFWTPLRTNSPSALRLPALEPLATARVSSFSV